MYVYTCVHIHTYIYIYVYWPLQCRETGGGEAGLEQKRPRPVIQARDRRLRMYVCMHACMYVCVCMYIYIYIHIYQADLRRDVAIFCPNWDHPNGQQCHKGERHVPTGEAKHQEAWEGARHGQVGEWVRSPPSMQER